METTVISETLRPPSRVVKMAYAGSGIGFAAGVAYAFHKKTGFWKGWGIAIIGGIATGGLFRAAAILTEKN
jgi:hypothetical protein